MYSVLSDIYKSIILGLYFSHNEIQSYSFPFFSKFDYRVAACSIFTYYLVNSMYTAYKEWI